MLDWTHEHLRPFLVCCFLAEFKKKQQVVHDFLTADWCSEENPDRVGILTSRIRVAKSYPKWWKTHSLYLHILYIFLLEKKLWKNFTRPIRYPDQHQADTDPHHWVDYTHLESCYDRASWSTYPDPDPPHIEMSRIRIRVQNIFFLHFKFSLLILIKKTNLEIHSRWHYFF